MAQKRIETELNSLELKREAVEQDGKERRCSGCASSLGNGRDGVYCRLFGIMIHKDHTGCRYFGKGSEGNEEEEDPA